METIDSNLLIATDSKNNKIRVYDFGIQIFE